MTMYEELIKRLRRYVEIEREEHHGADLEAEAADAIVELLKAARAMHTWIFLHTGDEQAAYDECHLSDEMNAALGYSGQFVATIPKGEKK